MPEILIEYILTIPVVLAALTIHEFSHGYAAYLLGDPTAKEQGRLSLNPLRHIDIFGALCMILFRFGWAKPVNINPAYFKKPKRDFAVTAVAGPLSNLLTAFISALIYLILLNIFNSMIVSGAISGGFAYDLCYYILLFIYLFHMVNLGLAIFNLIPLPPLDGSRVVYALLPERTYFKLMSKEQILYIILLVWIFIGDSVAYFFLSIPLIAANPLLSFLAGFFSLSGMISYVNGLLSDLMFSFWELIPFLKA